MEQLGEVTKYSDPAGLSWGLEESINAFIQGKAVFCEAWPTLGIIQKADDPEQSKIVGNWAIAPFPEEATGMKQMSIWCVAVSKYSQNKEAAFEWLKEYSSPEHQTQFYEEFGVLPSLTSFWEQPEVKDSVIGPLGEGLKKCLPKWRVPVSAELDTIMANAVSSYTVSYTHLDVYKRQDIGRMEERCAKQGRSMFRKGSPGARCFSMPRRVRNSWSLI